MTGLRTTLEQSAASAYPVQVIRLGSAKLDAEVPINGQEVLALYLAPGPISLEGIEVEVIGREDLDSRASGTSSRALIGPLEMEDLRERYFSLNQVLTTRSLPRARYEAPRIPGETGCLMVRTLGFGGSSCAAVVVDGAPVRSPGRRRGAHHRDPNGPMIPAARARRQSAARIDTRFANSR